MLNFSKREECSLALTALEAKLPKKTITQNFNCYAKSSCINNRHYLGNSQR